MIGMQSVGQRFEQSLFRADGLQIFGTIQPVEDGKIYPDDFFYVRQILRVRHAMPITSGTVVMTAASEMFILGDLDVGMKNDSIMYRSFQMYPVNRTVNWQRSITTLDPLTQQKKGAGLEQMGLIPVLIETLPREASSGTPIKEETKRVVTHREVELGDRVDKMTVRKVNISHGIRTLEIS